MGLPHATAGTGVTGAAAARSCSKNAWVKFVAVVLAAAVVISVALVATQVTTPKPKYLSEEEHERLRRNHLFLLIGGPHASGCSLLWKLVESHPSVSGVLQR